MQVLHTLLNKFLEDPNAVVASLALAVSIVCAAIAVREARAKAREAGERLEDAKQYRRALETVIRAGDSMPRHLEGIAEQTSEIVDLATREIKESVEHLKKASRATEEICKVLRDVGNVALRAQRDSARAHRELLGKIIADENVAKTSHTQSPPPHTAPEATAAAPSASGELGNPNVGRESESASGGGGSAWHRRPHRTNETD